MTRQKKFNIFITVFFVVCTVSLLGILVYSYFHFSQLKDGISETKLKADALAKRESMLATVEKNYQKVEEDIGETEIALPSQKEASKLIKDLESLANQNGLTFTSIRAAAGTKAGSDLSLTQTIKGKNSYELPLELGLEGTYGDFVNYIQKLENYKRLNNVISFTVGAAGGEESSENVNVKLKVTVYLDK